MNRWQLFGCSIFLGVTLVIVVLKLPKQEEISEAEKAARAVEQRILEERNKPVTYEQAVERITRDELEADLYELASDEFEGRMSGKLGNERAAKWILAQYGYLGLPTVKQPFPIERLNPGPKNEIGSDRTQNIFAYLEGCSEPDKVLVIGAHFDHIGYGPSMSRSQTVAIHNGADDNGSGTVGLVAIADSFSRLSRPKKTVVFAHFSGEEMGLVGSRYYCSHPLFPKSDPSIKKHFLMINLDMIGHLEGAAYSKPKPSSKWGQIGVKYPFLPYIVSDKTGSSDHASFVEKGVPVLFFNTGLHQLYHTPEDDANTIDYRGLTLVAKSVFELAWKYANEDHPF